MGTEVSVIRDAGSMTGFPVECEQCGHLGAEDGVVINDHVHYVHPECVNKFCRSHNVRVPRQG